MFFLLVVGELMNGLLLMDVLSYGKELGFSNECFFYILKGDDW